MAASLHSSCQLVVGPQPILELRRSPSSVGGYQEYGIEVNWYFNEVIHGPMEWLILNDSSFSTPIHLGDSLLSVRILYDFSTGLRGFSSADVKRTCRSIFICIFMSSIILSIVWISAD